MSRTFIKSTFILTIATLVSKILGSIFQIPLQNIAGDEVYGIFNLVYPVYMVALTLSVAGIPVAISKLISEARAKQDDRQIRDIFLTAGMLGILFGIISFLLIYAFSPQIAVLLGGESTRLALIIVSITLLIAPYMAVYRGFFQGYEDMKPTAISQVLEQFVRVAFILVIAYVLVQQARSNEMIAGGVMVGSSIGALCSLFFLRVIFHKSSLKPKKASKYTFQTFKKVSKTILKISLPICVGAITMALLKFVDSITLPYSLKAFGYQSEEILYLSGIYARGTALVQIATVVSSSIVLPIIPLITGNLLKNKWKETETVIVKAHHISHFISWPAAFGLLALTLPLNLALFRDLEGSMVLAIIGFSSLFTSFTILGTGILQGMNRANLAAFIIIGGVIVKIGTNLLFIQLFGLEGAAISTLVVYVLLCVVNTYFIWRTIRFPIWQRQTMMIVLSATIMGAIVGLPTLYFNISAWGRWQALGYSTVAIIVGGIIYGILVILLKGIDRETLQSFPVIGKLFQKVRRRA